MKAGAGWLAVLLLAACTHEPVPAPARQAVPADFPLIYYEQAAAQGRPVFRALPGESLVTIMVRRAGTLVRLGHDHIVSSSEVHGFMDAGASRADLYLLVDELVVDDPAMRAQAALDTQPGAADIAGTRSNMLASLEAQSYRYVGVRVSAVAQGAVDIEITLHGVMRRFAGVPAFIETSNDNMTASGELAILQSDFGITPFSILGGAIRVEDRLELRFRVRARRLVS